MNCRTTQTRIHINSVKKNDAKSTTITTACPFVLTTELFRKSDLSSES